MLKQIPFYYAPWSKKVDQPPLIGLLSIIKENVTRIIQLLKK